MKQNVQNFKNLLNPLFEKGIPSFWDEKGELFSQEHYLALLSQARMDHSKFEGLKRGIDGNTLVEKFTNDFEILIQFK